MWKEHPRDAAPVELQWTSDRKDSVMSAEYQRNASRVVSRISDSRHKNVDRYPAVADD